MAFVDKNMAPAQPADLDPKSMSLQDGKTPEASAAISQEHSSLVAFIKQRVEKSENSRRPHELRWLKAYRNYRGLYDPSLVFLDTEKSRVFIKITKTKTLAAYGQIVDVLFAGNKFPISVDPSNLPEGVKDAVHLDPQEKDDPNSAEAGGNPGDLGNAPDQSAGPQDIYGYEGDGKTIEPGATAETLGPLAEKLKDLPVKDGPGLTPTSVTFEPALVAAKKMEKKIQDQIESSNGGRHLRYCTFEQVLFGSGALKGPFAYNKEYPKWDDTGNYTPTIKLEPKIEAPSIWDLYNDPDAIISTEGEFMVQRHKYSRSQMRALKKRPHFRAEGIEKAIANGYNYNKKWWEDAIHDYIPTDIVERFEVLEYWGVMDKEVAEIAGLEFPKEFDEFDQVQVNAWICGNEILRIVLNPYSPVRIPYLIVPYEINPYSAWGIGVPENMEDTQILMNGFMRMTVDNAVLAGNLVFEVDETNLVPGQDMKIFPGKIFRRQGGAPGQSIFGTKFPSTAQDNMAVFDKARQLADEATGIPSYSHGQTGVSSMTRTSSGMSMLMGAAAMNIKTVVKNDDDYLLRPLGEALFAFNMQFAHDPSIKGDLEVRARGTESLLKTEIRSQKLMTFLQVGSANPATVPYMKSAYILREIASTLDLDPDKCCNDPAEALRQALIMQAHGMMPSPLAGQQPNAGPAGANVNDPTGNGGGQIGPGNSPQSGEAGFTGNAVPPNAGQGAQG